MGRQKIGVVRNNEMEARLTPTEQICGGGDYGPSKSILVQYDVGISWAMNAKNRLKFYIRRP